MSIPKIIHYCWFGGNPLPEMALHCIESWKKYCPDYEIVEWNEKNFDIDYNAYVREAYSAKKWAFVSDVARLYALYEFGGIYMDTDVEVLKSLDSLLECESFSGFESIDRIPTGIMASVKHQRFIKELLDDYKARHFLLPDGRLDTSTNVVAITNKCLHYGLVLNNEKQIINGFTLYPSDFFCPKDYDTLITTITANTYTIHHFNGSWKDPVDVLAGELKAKYGRIIPMKAASYLGRLIAVAKTRGIKEAASEFINWMRKKISH